MRRHDLKEAAHRTRRCDCASVSTFSFEAGGAGRTDVLFAQPTARSSVAIATAILGTAEPYRARLRIHEDSNPNTGFMEP